MKLYEYQAKQIFAKFGLPIPPGISVEDPSTVARDLSKLGAGPWAIKAQILAGGRGKAGGVKLLHSENEVKAFIQNLSGKRLVTHQTGPKGEEVVAFLAEKVQSNIVREMYVSVVLDRKSGQPVLIFSAEGGMEIESLAHTNPDAIRKIPIDPIKKLPVDSARILVEEFELKQETTSAAATFISRLIDLFFATDATLVEVNPWVFTSDGAYVALDGKIAVDDNALFRHPDFETWSAAAPLSLAEKRAAQAKISYIKLDGNVGCLVNGAGLAMATMDIIKLHGGEPANFLDVGGGANTEQVTEAFKIILSDPGVEGILVNIFGGIMRCDVIANGILAAIQEVRLHVPLVVRLEGNKAEEGRELLNKSRIPVISAGSFSEAARMIVQAVQGG